MVCGEPVPKNGRPLQLQDRYRDGASQVPELPPRGWGLVFRPRPQSRTRRLLAALPNHPPARFQAEDFTYGV